MPAEIELHMGRVQPMDWEEHEGYRVTAPLRTSLNAADGALSQEIIDAAVRNALDRGPIREKDLAQARTRGLTDRLPDLI